MTLKSSTGHCEPTNSSAVDYIGIGQNLKKALQNYTATDREQTGIDKEEAVATLQELVETCQDLFSGFDYRAGIVGAVTGAIEWVLQKQKARAREL